MQESHTETPQDYLIGLLWFLIAGVSWFRRYVSVTSPALLDYPPKKEARTAVSSVERESTR